MDSFTVTRYEEVSYRPLLLSQRQGHGHPAPGHVVMVLREGSGWVASEDDSHAVITAPTVVTWHPGDWIEYGSDGSSEFRAEFFWATDMSEQDRHALLTDVFAQK